LALKAAQVGLADSLTQLRVATTARGLWAPLGEGESFEQQGQPVSHLQTWRVKDPWRWRDDGSE
jgi:hypothetical protein